jgi:hypothetical protein
MVDKIQAAWQPVQEALERRAILDPERCETRSFTDSCLASKRATRGEQQLRDALPGSERVWHGRGHRRERGAGADRGACIRDLCGSCSQRRQRLREPRWRERGDRFQPLANERGEIVLQHGALHARRIGARHVTKPPVALTKHVRDQLDELVLVAVELQQ